MTAASPAFDPTHPLQADRQRLDEIADVMYAEIHKTLFSERRRPGERPATERILSGSAVSANDVLAEAVEHLLRHPPSRLRESWEALGVTIARNKAVSALRAAGAGLRGTNHREPLHLVSIDTQSQTQDSDSAATVLQIPANGVDPEEAYIERQHSLKLRDFARDVLDQRPLEVFFAIHFEGRHRADIGEKLGVTGQRVSQIYRKAYEYLRTHPDNPFKSDQSQQGGTDDHRIPRPR